MLKWSMFVWILNVEIMGFNCAMAGDNAKQLFSKTKLYELKEFPIKSSVVLKSFGNLKEHPDELRQLYVT